MSGELSIFWLRRDLRLKDNAGLYHALKEQENVLPLFIFDSTILEKLEDREDKRVQFIHLQLQSLKKELRAMGSDLLVKHGKPSEIWTQLTREYRVKHVYCNRDYEPYAKERDEEVKQMLGTKGISFYDYKDQCIFEFNEVLKPDRTPYTVFTPYYKRWLEKLDSFYLKSYPCEKYYNHFYSTAIDEFPSLESLGFRASTFEYPPAEIPQKKIMLYEAQRDYPAMDGSSHLSIHFRFGTISIREKAARARELSDKWLAELAWRDFYMQILAHFPYVVKGAFKPAYEHIEWRNDEQEFKAWCEGKTGYPIVDAGMRELNATGFMHNRVRMIVASFLCKHLLIDWCWGESYFAGKLLDYELASNNGGWQWAAGSGVDAAPYFRVFNPSLQEQKFDPEQEYIRKWVPEFGTKDYPAPIVEHTFARERCLAVYKKALKP